MRDFLRAAVIVITLLFVMAEIAAHEEAEQELISQQNQ